MFKFDFLRVFVKLIKVVDPLGSRLIKSFYKVDDLLDNQDFITLKFVGYRLERDLDSNLIVSCSKLHKFNLSV